MSEINACENIEGLKHVYSKYPSLQKQIHNAIINRKNQIENIASHVVDEKEIVKPLIEETHGIST
jgi:lantibiotic modifying enzyme